MAEKLTFIHASDMHIGAPFRGLRSLSPEWADCMMEAIPQAFDRLIDEAIRRCVDFVVIPGDIFDISRPSYRDVLLFTSGMQRLYDAGIPVYFCTGNHDPLTSWKDDFVSLPENVHMFPADDAGFFLYERNGQPLALLGGRGYYNRVVSSETDIAEGITRAAAQEALGTTAPFAVGVIHTGLNLDPIKAPTDPAKLLASGMDYWACGHIHMPWLDDERNPRIGFSGCIQGRDIKETGPRGCYCVTLAEGAANSVEFIPLASVVWQKLQVPMNDCVTLAQAQDAINAALFAANGSAHCEEMVARVMLTGRSPLHRILVQPGVLEDLRQGVNEACPAFFVDTIINRTTAPIDRAALKQEGLFEATLLSSNKELGKDTDATVAYLQDAFLDKGLQLPNRSVRHLGRLQKEAEQYVLDLLDGSRS